MSNTREQVLDNIRRSLGVRENDEVRRMSAMSRMEAARPGIQPARGRGTPEERIAMFTTQAQSVSATVARVDTQKDVPGEIARFLRDNNLPATVRMGNDERLRTIDWNQAAFEISHGASDGTDLNAVSHAEGGVAETGTLALVSGPHNPTTLNFLPDNHIVILQADRILATYEAVLAQLRSRFGKSVMPRTVNLITGPSRSADIEQKLLLGAHGPRRLHIVIVGSIAGNSA
ncbi:MAG: lactate utilization protein [Hyphomicrobiales bacterium]|nr:lactate utilization protein [Hyphomicrobiales bacterium]